MYFEISMGNCNTVKPWTGGSVRKFVLVNQKMVEQSTEAWIRITGAYLAHYVRAFGDQGLDVINGKLGKEAVPILQEAVELLGTTPGNDYFDPTPGNAGIILNIVLNWGVEHPEGIFYVRQSG